MIEIQKLTPGDGQRLKPIRIRALSSDPDAFGTTVEQVLRFDIETWNEQSITLPTFIGVHKGQDLGMVRVGKDQENPEAIAWLISMWVAPQARGTGMAIKLIEALEQHCRNEKIEVILLDVADDNPAAIKLYQKCGFLKTGITGTLPEPRTHITEFQMKKILR